ncbi:putative bacteriophage tail fiber assembly protein [Pectobacterium atrosepticum SCRI1043]|uniref:Bacteriophage tail fiber assembly protein n=1 Tax=Pectobacterium atrosepticum (strain SCRI 1043 / ATCC BAA-672) TaxID=218491 RepID=Q6D0Q6_PECAS|nr:tail fiber assembly protein [Pectobacterium atrosepticum]AIA72764.1 tail assembly protein [Pectobacterium atrosepticum]AIK15747.1 putative bacteriophage tail fiber assembly protein [Pectobacterium atrosepticum]MCL6317781.1 tail fiber assembly protein [Pectobacterium atrosepticum]MCL6322326.1 tail fiber assembly protein [Pectobacterium atrosepticum]POW25383.1 tail assembly protein [Pectobacterium atrosepticum]
MSNYSTQIKNAELNERGLAINTGWITVYHVNPATREYQSASYEYVMQGVGIPADSYADEPQLPPVGQALRRSADGRSWEQVPDYRGQTVYSTETRQSQVVTQFGELPGNFTLLKPAATFDVWNGKAWALDKDAQAAAVLKAAQQELAARKAAATTRINELTYAVNLDIATDDEKAALVEWQKYVVLLSRVDVNAADVVRPPVPSS